MKEFDFECVATLSCLKASFTKESQKPSQKKSSNSMCSRLVLAVEFYAAINTTSEKQTFTNSTNISSDKIYSAVVYETIISQMVSKMVVENSVGHLKLLYSSIHFYNNFETIQLKVFESSPKPLILPSPYKPYATSYEGRSNLSTPSVSSAVNSTELSKYPSSPLSKNFQRKPNLIVKKESAIEKIVTTTIFQ
ncbi:1300_t:CDS:2 [Diversispora eburnea]|uniref:1300_t:CDS:1 n=1 Tax=Diversispora eburnea TaxID=1213867 RepID=A0A9N8ZK41_9GLOM|nr:1300_t:CDS:2 [Diversispora eburnea]